jgi:hypothetical protein
MSKTVVGITDTSKFEKTKTEPVVYKPPKIDGTVLDYTTARVKQLKDARKRKLPGLTQSIEDIWKEIEREVSPHELGTASKKVLVTDEEKGLRGRYVDLNKEDDWQSHYASPDLYVKLSTAMSLLINQNPEATFEATSSKYEANTKIAEANWKQSWYTSGAKKELKLFVFNQGKYGVGFFQTIPELDIREKSIRTELHPDDAKKNIYEKRQIIRRNGLSRKSLNPWNVWMDDAAKPGRYDDVRDCYHEVEMSEEDFKLAFPIKKYPMVSDVTITTTERPEDDDNPTNTDKDSVTETPNIVVGYYENCVTDLYAIILPAKKKLLYASPLPNDEGKLSITYAPWTLRSDDTIYGIGIYEIIRGDSVLYDRVSNMSVDQLTLSIYKSFFHKSMDMLGEDGTLKISPGIGQAVTDPASIKWMEVPGPGKESAVWLQFLQQRRDTNSGVPQQLYGQSGGKTLGQDLQAKEAALQRLKLPLDFIIDMLEQEAYLTLSWQSQILSTPEILEYVSLEDLEMSLRELDLSDEQIQKYLEVAQNPQVGQELLNQQTTQGAEGEESTVKRFANVYPETSFNLEQDTTGTLFESEKKRFYRWGLDLPTRRLSWKGLVRIIPQSVLVPSKELERRLDLDLFNLVYPSIQAMIANPAMIAVLILPIKEVIKSFDKDPKEWINEKELMSMYEASKQPVPPGGSVKPSLSIQLADLNEVNDKGMPIKLSEAQRQLLEKYFGIKIIDPIFVKSGMNPQMGAESMGESPTGGEGGGVLPPEFSTKSGIEAPQVADLGKAPQTMEGAVEASNRIV